MDTCIRGFSFMTEEKVEVIDMQYIEGSELARAWKTTRREKVKQQEQKIWQDFVQERDVVKSVVTDDPYQFLDQIQESSIRELVDDELKQIKSRMIGQEDKGEEHQEMGNGDSPHNSEDSPAVTFAEPNNDSDVFHIFDDEVSADEEEPVLNDSLGSPCTVRENENSIDGENEDVEDKQIKNTTNPDKAKSSENVSNLIENSIYFAKVIDLRQKIDGELLNIITTLEAQNIAEVEVMNMTKIQKHSTEFCARFNRVHIYQMQRQMHDIERHRTSAPVFARHTHQQAQLVRVVTLHQTALNALQVLQKHLEQYLCLKITSETVLTMLTICRQTETTYKQATTASILSKSMCNDEISTSCGKLQACLEDYTERLKHIIEPAESFAATSRASRRKKSTNKNNLQHIGTSTSRTSKIMSDSEARLSMYSFDSRGSKHYSVNGGSSATSKYRLGITANKAGKTVPDQKVDAASKAQKKITPRSRRPLMRAPDATRPRAVRPQRDSEIRTMVEQIDCPSSRISREPSPYTTPKRSCENTPRDKKKLGLLSDKQNPVSPRLKTSRCSPKPLQVPLPCIRSARGSRRDPLICAESKNTGSYVKPQSSETEECIGKEVSKVVVTPRSKREQDNGQTIDQVAKSAAEDAKIYNSLPATYEVGRLLRQLCNGNPSSKKEIVTGAKNAQLLCVNAASPRQSRTPQILKILEETIQKKSPRSETKASPRRDPEKCRLKLTTSPTVADGLFQYRSKFVQHMLCSSMYTNSSIGKPWEMLASVSEKIIDELLFSCTEELQIKNELMKLYMAETQ